MHISNRHIQGMPAHGNDDDDDETFSFTCMGQRDAAHMKRGNYNRTNPGHIKRLTKDLFCFTLCQAAFFLCALPFVGGFSINDAIEG